MPRIGVREFQLVLLRRMADFQPGLVEDAARSLGASRTEAREVNATWQRMLRSPRAPAGVRRYTTVLGAPESDGERAVGDLTCRVLRWPLPLWPQLRFEVVALGERGGGGVLQEWLVRAPGSPPPALRAVGDLAPWSCVVGDVGRAFAPAQPLEGTAPARWRLAFTADDGAGAARRYVADFTWGLLQEVRALVPAPAAGGPAAG
ncbi:hypothetical protein ACFPZ0_18330 [Streptomonospora nanhaiensis]|uniref:Uncharacterized protein n=1 Tax=Streptomonospora nanhaiensis TaxID=1323731 RepID=A0A853BGX4_9ACTN|nr:hypothetical protein [Streptomonospora nanhaiensis]NYI93796.1 hypothetical protein [Streptomonospora nanhaiensis]